MAKSPSALEDFEFDLRGYLVLDQALSPNEVQLLNTSFDQFADIATGDWIGNAQRRDYTAHTGFELHNAIDCGDRNFEMLIDHPSWIGHMRRYVGEEGSYVEGLALDENIASIRRSGGHHPVHSGGYQASTRTQYRYEDGRFRCGLVNVIVALANIGPGDGATMVIPGSHKSRFPHPLAGDYARGDRMDALPGSIEVHMKAGDALLFSDAIMHGGSSRTTAEGERRVVILRYGPSWGTSRFGYRWSSDLLDRLTPDRRRILEPVPPIESGATWIPQEAPRVAVGAEPT